MYSNAAWICNFKYCNRISYIQDNDLLYEAEKICIV